MHSERYVVVSDNDHERYEFLSEGPNGIIRKVIFYRKMSPNFFNLGFGDWEEVEHIINDLTRSNNDDRDKVLTTVAFTVIDFIQFHPNVVLFVKGSTPARTRLYQMGIAAYWHEISHLFEIKGFYNGDWHPFERGRNYEAFVLKEKM